MSQVRATVSLKTGSWTFLLCPKEAKVVIEGRRMRYDTQRPQSWLRYRPAAPEGLVWPAPTPGLAAGQYGGALR
jgi:hypothetical protein